MVGVKFYPISQVVFVNILGSFHSSLRMLKRTMFLHSPLVKRLLRTIPSFLKPAFPKTARALNELASKFQTAFGTAIDKEWRGRFDMSNYVEDFHIKIAQLFLKAGLTGITMNGHLSTFLLCDERRSTEELRTHLRARLSLWKRLEKRNEHCALVGGMNEKEYRELSQRYTEYLENLIAKPNMIKKTPEVHMVSRVIVCSIKSADEK